jgi:hypothetical protein
VPEFALIEGNQQVATDDTPPSSNFNPTPTPLKALLAELADPKHTLMDGCA